ncbi:glycoside hydrolase family 3 protein [uncultured Ruthenibacterium sp.]|uniref:glycoside hydrolase family 3 protein n=1 Tax=uncultured Ruthenibacterium sp. TaxID=1905347 RepID=UPI00349EE207
MIDIKAKPFYLSDEDVRWVTETLQGMSLKQKVGQLFCPIGETVDEKELAKIFDAIEPCGIMYRTTPAADVQRAHRFLQQRSAIPLLVAANLEMGGRGIAAEGTIFGTQMEVAATDNTENAYRLGLCCGREGGAVGVNWSFAPVVDIDRNWRNPITNTRTYGSDADRVLNMARAYIRGIEECGMAVSIKHFPGDGADERDQHMHPSVNDLSVEEWDESYGKIYKTLIDEGAQTVMIGHILQPAYQRALNPDLRDEDMAPASLSPELLQGLLRKKLGFNGVIVSDSTRMTGFLMSMPREKAVPYCIAAGCDMFLFDLGIEQDFAYMMQGIEDGVLTRERVDEAVTRILALKASLGLHKKQKDHTLVPGPEALSVLGCQEHRDWAAQCANEAITLVKDKAPDVLPLTVEKYPRIQLHVLGEHAKSGNHAGGLLLAGRFKARLEQEGFQVTLFDAKQMSQHIFEPNDVTIGDTDLVLYYANEGTYSNKTIVRLDWAVPNELNGPKFLKEVPNVFVSVANPYHLLDAPRMQTFINAYTPNEEVIDALVDKLMGRSPFLGTSPVDPFCDRWDTHL